MRRVAGTGAGDLKHTPLEAEHRELGAKLGPFAGWLMPIEYAGTLAEHRGVRQAVGLFDLMHLGKVTIEGPEALDALQRAVTNDVSKADVGAAQYNTVLNERGGIVDDLIVYRLGEERFFVVPNAANTAKVVSILREAARSAEVRDHSDWGFMAVQGPRAVDVVGEVLPEASGLSYLRCTETEFGGEPLVLARTGYTGEVGFELFPAAGGVVELWRALLRAGEPQGLQPVGLGARDTLRLEMGYPLHGQDISEARTPLEAGLSWAVSLDKGEFRGRDALVRQKEEGIPRRLWGLRMQDRLIPRAHQAVMHEGEQVGEVTSGTFSPSLRVGIALGYLEPRDRFAEGDEVEVDVRGRLGRAAVTKPPFVDSSPRS